MSLFTGGIALAAALAATGGTVAAAKMQSGAAKQAADLSARGVGTALDYTKQKDADERVDQRNAGRANYDQFLYEERQNAPRRAQSVAATQSLHHLLGLPDVELPQPPPMPEYLREPVATAPSTSALVRVKAPTGQIKVMPRAQAEQFVQRGARIL